MSFSVENLLIFEDSKESYNFTLTTSSLLHIGSTKGKTTLFNILIGVGSPFCGVSSLFGKVVDLSSSHNDGDITLFKETSAIFSKHALLSNLTVSENLELALSHKSHEMSSIERESIINEHISLCGLSRVSDKRPCELTSSQAKVISFIRGIIVKPVLLIWDDPFIPSSPKLLDYFKKQIEVFKFEQRIIIALGSDEKVAQRLSLNLIGFNELRKSA